MGRRLDILNSGIMEYSVSEYYFQVTVFGWSQPPANGDIILSYSKDEFVFFFIVRFDLQYNL